MKNLTLAICALNLLLTGCAMRTKILDAAAISMTRTSLNAGESLKEAGPVSGKFCADTWSDKGTIGLIDNAVMSAQKQAQVDVILSASFWQEGSCVDVEGTGAKIVAANGAATGNSAQPTAQPATKPAKHKTK